MSSMVYVVIMAVAFVAFVCLATILFVTKKKEQEEYDADDRDEELYVSGKKERTVPRQEEVSNYVDELHMQDRADYGYSELNPVVTTSSSASERYLAALRTERGEGLRWIREGTLSVKKLNDRSNVNVECYTLYLYGKEYKKLYVCPSGRRNSNDAPKGLILSTDGKKLSYNGSISLEASEKGISEEQVLEKYAFVYENKRQSDTVAKKPFSNSTGKLTETSKSKPVSYPAESNTSSRPKSSAKEESWINDRPYATKAEEKKTGSFPKYLPGFEPEEMKPALERFLTVMDREYPDGVIIADTWDHSRWDRAASMLCKYLGYDTGSDILEAYGYTVEK